MHGRYKIAMLAAVCAALPLLMGQSTGFPSRPRFQSVGVNVAAPATGNLTASGTVTAANYVGNVGGVAPSDFARASQTNTFTQSNLFSNSYSTAGTQALRISASTPAWSIDQSGASANNRLWLTYVVGEALRFGVANDTEATITDWLTVNRTGTTVDSVNLQATAVQVNGATIPKFAFGVFTNACGSNGQSRGVSCSDGGTGIFNFTFSPTFTSAAPACTATIAETSAGEVRLNSYSTSALSVSTFNSSGAATDMAVSIMCIGV